MELMSDETVTAVHGENSELNGFAVLVFVAMPMTNDPGASVGAFIMKDAFPAPSVRTENERVGP